RGACASAAHASVAGAAAGHDGSAGGAGGGVAHVDDVLHGVGDVVDASVFEGRDGGVEAAAGAQVGGDSLLGWGGGVVVVGWVRGRKVQSAVGRVETLGVLRLRAARFAQDDGGRGV